MPSHRRMRAFDRDLIRGGHYGQRSCEPHLKAEHMAAPTNAANVKKVLANPEPSTHGTFVWTGRALQAGFDDLETIGLALLYPALERSVCAPGHHGYPRTSDLILRKALKGRWCYQITDATARPFLHLLNPTRRPRQVNLCITRYVMDHERPEFCGKPTASAVGGTSVPSFRLGYWLGGGSVSFVIHATSATNRARAGGCSSHARLILVTGAAGAVGSIGRIFTEMLLAKGHKVRALVRREDERAEALRQLGAEVMQGDLTDLTAMHRAIEGCASVYFGMSVSADYLMATVNTAAVARHHGVEAFANMSLMTVTQMSITENTDSPQHKLHWLAEQALFPVVTVRPTVFLDGFFRLFAAPGVRDADELALPMAAAKPHRSPLWTWRAPYP